ncbi:MAG: hypothetical protein V3R16_02545 [Nitrospirales bacterium]
MTPEAIRRLERYVKWLEVGASTHARYAQVANDQALKTDEPLERAIVELQACVNTLGLTIALGSLSLLAAHGVAVPEPPEMVKAHGENG